MNRETRTAERIAFAADREFHPLLRDRDSHARMLETSPPAMNFQGRFGEAHVTEFGDWLRGEVDAVISGLGADTLFREHAFPVPTADLGPLGRFDLPFTRDTRSVEQFVERRARPLPDYLDAPFDPADVLRRNIRTGPGSVVDHHGVEYRTVDELVFFDDFHPFSNKSDFFFHALNQTANHWSPFFDNRLIDLALRLPRKYRVRRNIVDAATIALDRPLAEVPNSSTGVPPTRGFPASYLLHHANAFAWKSLSSDTPPKPYLSHGPWPSMPELIRTHEFVPEALDARADIIDALPFLDPAAVEATYRDHLNGADNTFVLYTLLSFLGMPVTARAAARY